MQFALQTLFEKQIKLLTPTKHELPLHSNKTLYFNSCGQKTMMASEFNYTMTSTDDAISIFMGVMFTLITFIGVPLNIKAIKDLREGSSSQFRLIEQLPISMCFCNLIQVFPLYILNAVCAFARKWILGLPMCQFMGFWVHFNANSSIWHLVAYALEQRRLVASNSNINSAQHNTANWKTYAPLVLVWMHGFFWSVIPFSGWCGYQFEGIGLSCSVTWERTDAGSISYTICILIFNFIIPVVVIAYCYLKIFMMFKSHIAGLPSSLAASTEARNKAKLHKLAVIACVMTGSFLFCWAPYAMVGMYMIFMQRPALPLLVTLPALFAKCSVVIFPAFIVMKKAAFKLRLNEAARPVVTKTNEHPVQAVTKT